MWTIIVVLVKRLSHGRTGLVVRQKPRYRPTVALLLQPPDPRFITVEGAAQKPL